MMTPFAQVITQSSFFYDWYRFKKNLRNLQSVQTHILNQTLKDHPFLKNKNDFHQCKMADYEIQIQRLNEKNFKAKRIQPTSGSGAKEKLIPYTDPFIKQLNKALNPWLFDMTKQFPGILLGKHFWSISWLPTHWREKNWQLDDFELLPAWKKNLTHQLMAVPNEVSKATTLEASQFATLAYLISCQNLTFFSVWSPTFLIQLLDKIKTWESSLCQTLETGKWAMFSAELNYLIPPNNPDQAKKLSKSGIANLWPMLTLLSSWNSSTSLSWAEKLQSIFPHTSFQGKGLWATEGVVSIPFEKKYLLSYFSHYYEFLDLKSGNILSSWELKEGMEVYPLITSANGFVRYNLKDRMIVTGFHYSIPTLEFLERDHTFDMVGEKLDSLCFLNIHHEMKKKFPKLQWVIVFAINELAHKPFYHFIFEGHNDKNEVSSYLTKLLKERFHYQLARELGQLGDEVISILPNGFNLYQAFQTRRGMIQGNIKVELSTMIKNLNEKGIYDELFTRS